MVGENNAIETLKQAGFDHVYVWHAGPFEEDREHSHPFDVHLLVLEGEIKIEVGAKSTLLKPTDQLDIPRDTLHSGVAGPEGCKYIVAEKK